MKTAIRSCLLLLATLLMLNFASTASARPVIGMVTDFGLENEAVGLCKGAIARINPDALVVDVTHNIEEYSIRHAALVLRRTTVFPKGTVFVCVVDPGVGTSRRGIALETSAGFIYVGPDNGVFSLVAREQGVKRVVELEPKKVNPDWKPGTFDGRDLFSPAGAVIATSGDIKSAGDLVDQSTLKTTEFPVAVYDSKSRELRGEYLRTDQPYGNVWTNITADDLMSAGMAEGSELSVTVGEEDIEVPFAVSFGHVKEGKPLGYLSSDGTFALAVNMGNFQSTYKVEEGTSITLKLKHRP